MSLLMKAVADFLGLSDTPADYAGEGLRGARVNVAEDAIEFGPSWEGPTNPTWESGVIFGPAAPPAAWTDLDIGVGPCIAYLKVEGSQAVLFRRTGETINCASGLTMCVPQAGQPLAYVVVVTDENGFVQWESGGAAVTITRLAHWANPPMPNRVIASGASAPVGYAALDVGVKNALAILAVRSSRVGNWDCWFAEYGETQDSRKAGIVGATIAVDRLSYVLVLTDGEGRVQWSTYGPNFAYEITLVTYILGIERFDTVLYHGPHPTEWTDMDTPFGKGFLYIKGLHDVVVANVTIRFRENGSALEANDGLAAGAHIISAALNEINYAFIPLDEYGTVEWRRAVGDNAELLITALAISR